MHGSVCHLGVAVVVRPLGGGLLMMLVVVHVVELLRGSCLPDSLLPLALMNAIILALCGLVSPVLMAL